MTMIKRSSGKKGNGNAERGPVIKESILLFFGSKKSSQTVICELESHGRRKIRCPDFQQLSARLISQNLPAHEVSYPMEMRMINYGKTTAYDPKE